MRASIHPARLTRCRRAHLLAVALLGSGVVVAGMHGKLRQFARAHPRREGRRGGPGWDPVTGWGSPNAQVLVPLLADSTGHGKT